MKYISEYRDADLVNQYLEEIRHTVTRPWTIMEVCGGQTHSLVKNGILNLLPPEVQMVHGPGCPVCVTPLNLIDKAVYLAEEKGVILCSYGDMIRVPGSKRSLLEAKARGADIRILYSPLEAVKIAQENPDREVVFFAVGFETTAPADALSVGESVRLLTSDAAYAAFAEDRLGRISVGMLADLTLIEGKLSLDDKEPVPSDLPRRKVLLTVVDGVVVYDGLGQNQAHRPRRRGRLVRHR